MITRSELFKAAAAKIAPPGTWTQKAGARDAGGQLVTCTSNTAVCWCGLGAVNVVLREATDLNMSSKDFNALWDHLVQTDGSAIIQFNDNPDTTQQQVVNLLLELAEK